jgi:hypothetical protein
MPNHVEIFWHPHGRPDRQVRPEVEVIVRDADGRVAASLVWSVQDDQHVNLHVTCESSADLAVSILRAYLKAEGYWDTRQSLVGICGIFTAIDERVERDLVLDLEAQDRGFRGIL